MRDAGIATPSRRNRWNFASSSNAIIANTKAANAMLTGHETVSAASMASISIPTFGNSMILRLAGWRRCRSASD
jgi:hypothetical protein